MANSASEPGSPAAYEIRSNRLLLRCWSLDDAPDFCALLDRNFHHLEPFIPWMRAGRPSLEATVARLRDYRAKFDSDVDFRYAMVLRETDELIGELMLSTRTGPASREVGYLVDQAHTGRGLATEASAMGIRVALQLYDCDRVELHCSPHNAASIRVAEHLGFAHEATLGRRYEVGEGDRQDSMIWTLFRDRANVEIMPAPETEAFDVLGRKLAM